MICSRWLLSKSSLSPNIRYEVLCAAIKAKSIPNLEKEVFKEYRADPNSGVAIDLRNAVTCSKDEDFLKMWVIHKNLSLSQIIWMSLHAPEM